MATKKELREVLADAFALDTPDRAMLENYMRASRVAGLDIEPASIRRSSDEVIRDLWGGKAA